MAITGIATTPRSALLSGLVSYAPSVGIPLQAIWERKVEYLPRTAPQFFEPVGDASATVRAYKDLQESQNAFYEIKEGVPGTSAEVAALGLTSALGALAAPSEFRKASKAIARLSTIGDKTGALLARAKRVSIAAIGIFGISASSARFLSLCGLGVAAAALSPLAAGALLLHYIVGVGKHSYEIYKVKGWAHKIEKEGGLSALFPESWEADFLELRDNEEELQARAEHEASLFVKKQLKRSGKELADLSVATLELIDIYGKEHGALMERCQAKYMWQPQKALGLFLKVRDKELVREAMAERLFGAQGVAGVKKLEGDAQIKAALAALKGERLAKISSLLLSVLGLVGVTISIAFPAIPLIALAGSVITFALMALWLALDLRGLIAWFKAGKIAKNDLKSWMMSTALGIASLAVFAVSATPVGWFFYSALTVYALWIVINAAVLKKGFMTYDLRNPTLPSLKLRLDHGSLSEYEAREVVKRLSKRDRRAIEQYGALNTEHSFCDLSRAVSYAVAKRERHSARRMEELAARLTKREPRRGL